MFNMYDMYGGAKKSSPKSKKTSPKKSNKRCSSSNPAYVKWKASAPKGAKCIAHSKASNRSEANTRNKRAVYNGTAFKTASGLVKDDIKLNNWKKPVSKKASAPSCTTLWTAGSSRPQTPKSGCKRSMRPYSGSPRPRVQAALESGSRT